MEILQTGEFEKDVARLGKSVKEQVSRAIRKISKNPGLGKPMRHLDSVFSERVSNFRLLYRFKDGKLLLLCFKNRDEVYDYLKR